jgi:hypothetical protein
MTLARIPDVDYVVSEYSGKPVARIGRPTPSDPVPFIFHSVGEQTPERALEITAELSRQDMIRALCDPAKQWEKYMAGRGESYADVLRGASDEEIAWFIYDLLSGIAPMNIGKKAHAVILHCLRKKVRRDK